MIFLDLNFRLVLFHKGHINFIQILPLFHKDHMNKKPILIYLFRYFLKVIYQKKFPSHLNFIILIYLIDSYPKFLNYHS